MARLKTFRGLSVKKQFKLENGMIRVKLYDLDVSPEDWDKFSGNTYFDGDQRRDIAKTNNTFCAEGNNSDEHQRNSNQDGPAVRPDRSYGRRASSGKLAAG